MTSLLQLKKMDVLISVKAKIGDSVNLWVCVSTFLRGEKIIRKDCIVSQCSIKRAIASIVLWFKN